MTSSFILYIKYVTTKILLCTTRATQFKCWPKMVQYKCEENEAWNGEGEGLAQREAKVRSRISGTSSGFSQVTECFLLMQTRND